MVALPHQRRTCHFARSGGRLSVGGIATDISLSPAAREHSRRVPRRSRRHLRPATQLQRTDVRQGQVVGRVAQETRAPIPVVGSDYDLRCVLTTLQPATGPSGCSPLSGSTAGRKFWPPRGLSAPCPSGASISAPGRTPIAVATASNEPALAAAERAHICTHKRVQRALNRDNKRKL